ncbi:MAG: hypothetical protein ABJO67_03755 [Pseudoruegeria sp.]
MFKASERIEGIVQSMGVIDQSYVDFAERASVTLSDLMSCISSTLGVEFEGSEKFVPAALIFNPLAADCGIWFDTKKAYGKARTSDAIERLSEVEVWLLGQEVEELTAMQLQRMTTRLRDDAGPLYFLISIAVLSGSRTAILDALELLLEHLRCCNEAEKTEGGNYRAFRTALALRAIFETYSDIEITAGDDAKGNPSGEFCSCLERVFEIVSLDVGFRHYARKAQERRDNDPMLNSMKQELIDVPIKISNFGL